MTEGTRWAVITGADRGIGQAVAVRLAAEGYGVVGTARDPASLEATGALVEAQGGHLLPLACDVRDEASVATMARRAEAQGPVRVVVANAGVAGPTAPLQDITLQEWRDCLQTDLDGVFLTFRAFVPGLVARREGALMAISSMTGKRPLYGRTPYAAAKLGVLGLVRTLALELGPSGVRVNAICPGAVAGPRIEAVVRRQAQVRGISEAAARGSFTDASPLGRLVRPEEIAAACAYLASAGAASVTGEDLNVTAGVVMY